MSHLKKAKKEHLIATKVTNDIKRQIELVCEEENRTTANFLQKILQDYFQNRTHELNNNKVKQAIK